VSWMLPNDNDNLESIEDKTRELRRLDEERIVERVELAEFRPEAAELARGNADVLRVLLNSTRLTVELA
jgi:hypothetical protein